jgi:uncharacterized metal-binding protein YceD (DUF177 family)
VSTWPKTIRLSELARGPVQAQLEADEAARKAIAKELSLVSLPKLTAQVVVRPWLDGAEISGRLQASVEQVCGVTAEAFVQELEGVVDLRVVPAGSPNAPQEDTSEELAIDAEAPDPPDVLPGEEIDLAAYVVEHLALEIDPFPRKPGAEFDYAPDAPVESPFAVLKRLKGEDE